MATVSIIIPIYNSEASLPRCLNSILSQTYKDFELVLVNDGSTDSSLEICYNFSKIDERVKVITKPNAGVSSARNFGLDAACGEWIAFVDSDDWITENYFAAMLDNEHSDIIVGSLLFNSSKNVGTLCHTSGHYNKSDMYTVYAEDFYNSLLNSPCAKIFKREIIQTHNLKFDEKLVFGEDSIFVKRYLLYVNSICICNSMLYVYNDIGDDVYTKYSKTFLPIYDFYKKMLCVCSEFEKKFNILISKKELVGVAYNLSAACLERNGLTEYKYIRKFYLDRVTRDVLMRRSLHICIILLLSYDPLGLFFITYYQLTKILKKIKSYIGCF